MKYIIVRSSDRGFITSNSGSTGVTRDFHQSFLGKTNAVVWYETQKVGNKDLEENTIQSCKLRTDKNKSLFVIPPNNMSGEGIISIVVWLVSLQTLRAYIHSVLVK